jgi:cation diffusion facilitator CzcD-associated flavoprotein CzcO
MSTTVAPAGASVDTGLEHVDVCIVGSGFSGIGMAANLRFAGREDFVILEQADGIGGTWRANHYPGAACDIQSHLYSFSFEPNPEWTRFYPGQKEILDYLERTVDRHDLRSRIRLNSEVTGARFDESTSRWLVEVNGQARLTARVLVSGIGGLSRPAYPKIEGLERFAGPVFHSAEWRHDVDLHDKRVAVIGTGASAIQFVPEIARQAAHIDVYQRTPPWVVRRVDKVFSERQRQALARRPVLRRMLRGFIYATQEFMAIGLTMFPSLMKGLEWAGRKNINRAITDPELRAKVTPTYRMGCKRILISNDWYRALARDTVDVVVDGITRVERDGIVTADGEQRPTDVIILGTGFRPTDLLTPLTIVGREGADINEVWAGGLEAHRGTLVHGFPNFFMLMGPNTGLGHNSQVYMIESQISLVMDAVRRMDKAGAQTIEVRSSAQRAYNDALQRRLERTVWIKGGCRSWYLDSRGRNTTLWPGFSFGFRRATRRVRTNEYVFDGSTNDAGRATPGKQGQVVV